MERLKLPGKKINIYMVLLLLIIICGVFVRFYGISSKSFWLDEAVSAHYSSNPISENLKWVISDINPPLYNIILAGWIRIFGISETAIRSLSVIFGSVCILLVYFIGKLMFSRKVGLVSAAMLALSPIQVYFSQEARSYAMFGMLSLISFIYYYKYAVSGSRKNIVPYLISTVLMLYTHNYGILVIVIQNVWFVVKYFDKFRKLKDWIVIQSILFLMYLPWVLVLLYIQIPKVASPGFTLGKPDIILLMYTFKRFAGTSLLLMIYIVIITVYIFKIFYFNSKSSSAEHSGFSLLFMWSVLSVIAAWLFSLTVLPIFQPRYLLFASIPLYILVALGLCKISKKKFIQVVLISCIILLLIFSLVKQSGSPGIRDWRSAGNLVRSQVAQDDIVLLYGSGYGSDIKFPFSYYYATDCFLSSAQQFQRCLKSRNVYVINNVYDLDSIPYLDGISAWFIMRLNLSDMGSRQAVLQHLLVNRQVMLNNTYANINVLYLEKTTE